VTDQPLTDIPEASAANRPASWERSGSHGTQPRGELATGWWRLSLLVAGVVALGLLAGRGWVFITVALFVMIFLHELGHFVTAKWTGMKVTEFFIGIGPKLWSFRRGETEYGVKLIPFVAYVRIIGMNNLDDCAPEDEPRTYRQQTFPRRLLVISAGSIMHFLQAFLLFVVLFAVVGVPGNTDVALRLGGKEPAWGITGLAPGGAAQHAGIHPGDRIVSIDGVAIDDIEQVGALVSARPGKHVVIRVDRVDEVVSIPVTIGHRPDDPNEGLLGVEMGTLNPDHVPDVSTNPVSSVANAAYYTGEWTWETVRGLGAFFTGGLGNFVDRVADGGGNHGNGPVVGNGRGGGSSSGEDKDRVVSMVGVARIGADAGQNDMSDFLWLLAIVNISIGVLNMLPLLPLDGGHAAIAVYERIRSTRGRRHMADVSRLLPLTYAVVLFLGLIMMSSIYLDIVDPVGLR